MLNAKIFDTSLQVAMRMKPNAALSVPPLETSMHKTYTDCYQMQGFVGGDWGYAVNTNSTGGGDVDLVEGRLQGEQRRLAIYFLGWESVEVCASSVQNQRNLTEKFTSSTRMLALLLYLPRRWTSWGRGWKRRAARGMSRSRNMSRICESGPRELMGLKHWLRVVCGAA